MSKPFDGTTAWWRDELGALAQIVHQGHTVAPSRGTWRTCSMGSCARVRAVIEESTNDPPPPAVDAEALGRLAKEIAFIDKLRTEIAGVYDHVQGDLREDSRLLAAARAVVAAPPLNRDDAEIADEIQEARSNLMAICDRMIDRQLMDEVEPVVERMRALETRLRDSRTIVHPTANPSPCPDCAAPRYWEKLSGGGVDSVCLSCGRRGANDDLTIVPA